MVTLTTSGLICLDQCNCRPITDQITFVPLEDTGLAIFSGMFILRNLVDIITNP